MYLIGDPKQAKIFFKPTPGLASHLGVAFALNYILGTPAHVVPLYSEDDSGQLAKPMPGSKTPGEHRIRYFHSRTAHRFLAGASGFRLGELYMDILTRNINGDTNIGKEWKESVDLLTFIQNLVFPASTESLCGSSLLSLNPTLTQDFWAFERSIPTLLKRVPRWLSPGAYKSREKMLDIIKRWHAYGNERTDCTKVGSEDPEWDPFLGSKFIRERQRFLQEIDIMDADGRASEDLGFLFAYVHLYCPHSITTPTNHKQRLDPRRTLSQRSSGPSSRCSRDLIFYRASVTLFKRPMTCDIKSRNPSRSVKTRFFNQYSRRSPGYA